MRAENDFWICVLEVDQILEYVYNFTEYGFL